LHAGESAPFSLRTHPLVHTLLHVPRPAVSMVIRTVRAIEYFRYFPPGVAIAVAEPDDFITRQIRMLEMFRVSRRAEYADVLCEFLESSDFETSFRVIAGVIAGDADSALRERAFETMLARHGAPAVRAREALEQAWWWQQTDALREQYTEHEDRFFASLLLCAGTRDRVLALTRAQFPGEDPVERLRGWVSRSGLFAPHERAQRITADAMVAHGDFEAVKSALRAAFSDDEVAQLEDGIVAWCAQSPLAPLLDHG
jgi:hypothetical protein